ncbi:hypothetical protein B0T20DRAFT_484372 [Sordaria brevicollis]|uniref:Uncharacterized protein n=1 Tax=Sordaria brevicollis TaxID=83679 RepID=A0AAE0U2K5_SORBR|nr:hypothetical protein B0T20DRAFT_484372 [Sordaria brevicollis]
MELTGLRGLEYGHPILNLEARWITIYGREVLLLTIFKPTPSPITCLATRPLGSLACNVMQAIGFAIEDEKELLSIAKECLSAISRLKAEAGKLDRPSAQGKALLSLRLALRAKARQGNIVNNKADALQLKTEAGFQQLDSTIRCFVEEALSEGQVNLQVVMKSHQESILEVVKTEATVQATATMSITNEVKKTQGMITEASSEALLRERRQVLLKSLKFGSMRERFPPNQTAF